MTQDSRNVGTLKVYGRLQKGEGKEEPHLSAQQLPRHLHLSPVTPDVFVCDLR